MMVRVTLGASDPITAWRVRDVLAAHPLLGGATAQISVMACHDSVILEGWTLDERLHQLALRLARQAAGRRSVQTRLRVQHCRPEEVKPDKSVTLTR
jgi:hypothetical protein